MYILANDFVQKNRNRAIQITDIAVAKVPRTHISGFDNEQNRHIQELHQLTLREAQELNQVCNTNDMEVGILVDIHSWEYWVIKGKNPREVEIKNNLEAYGRLIGGYRNQLMFIHNHPSTGTFSGEDFKMFCYHSSLYMMTVVGNDSSVYILIKSFEFDAEKAMMDYMRLSMKYYNEGYRNNNGTLAINEILKNANKYGLLYKKGRKLI